MTTKVNSAESVPSPTILQRSPVSRKKLDDGVRSSIPAKLDGAPAGWRGKSSGRCIRREVYKQLGNPDRYYLGDQQANALNAIQDIMNPEIERMWKELFGKGWKDCQLVSTEVTLPWPRLFCIGIDVHINTKRAEDKEEEKKTK